MAAICFTQSWKTEETRTAMQEIDLVTLGSGRRVAVRRLTRGDGRRTVVFCHPAPGAGNFDPNPEETAKREVTLIAVDRPGYGDSDPLPSDRWATVASAADDLAEVLQEMQLGPVGVAGWSAGGRVALALAARRPDLVDRVVILATPAPDELVPWIPPEEKQGLDAMRDLPPAEVHAMLAGQLDEMLSQGPSEARLAMLGTSPDDEEALAMPGAAGRLVGMLDAAFAQGATGLAADLAGYTLRPWGFEPSQLQAKTLCLYGARDPILSSRHGRWWQANLPQARLEMVPNAGHLLVIPMWKRALSHLAPRR